jgi:hypothetical protein
MATTIRKIPNRNSGFFNITTPLVGSRATLDTSRNAARAVFVPNQVLFYTPLCTSERASRGRARICLRPRAHVFVADLPHTIGIPRHCPADAVTFGPGRSVRRA